MDALLQKLDPKTLMLSMAGIVLLLAAGLAFGMIWPSVKEYRTAVDSRGVLQDLASKSGQLEGQLKSVDAEIEHLGQQLHGDMANLPEKQLEAFIIGRLQEISWRHNVELVSVRPSKGQKVQIFRELLFEVEVAGDYFQLFDWLKELGDKLGFVVVKQYAIRAETRNVDDPRLSVRLTMVSYRKT